MPIGRTVLTIKGHRADRHPIAGAVQQPEEIASSNGTVIGGTIHATLVMMTLPKAGSG